MTKTTDEIEIRDHRQPGWFWSQNELLDNYGAQIGPYGIAVYMVLARYVSNRTQKSRVGIRKMALVLGTGKEQVMKAVSLLESEGLINIFLRPGRTTEYALKDLKTGVPAPGTVTKEVSAKRVHVSAERVQGVRQAGTIQDLDSRLSLQEEGIAQWEKVKELSALEMTKAAWEKWLCNSRGLGWDDGVLVVGVQNAYAVDWLENRLQGRLLATLNGVMGREVGIRFEVKS